MKLTDLDASFLKRNADGSSETEGITLAEADGVMFQCPKCSEGKEKGESYYKEMNYFIGAHYVICWFKGKVPDDVTPKPGRWNPHGTGLHDLTFIPPGAVSVLQLSGCKWHGYVKNGDAS